MQTISGQGDRGSIKNKKADVYQLLRSACLQLRKTLAERGLRPQALFIPYH